VRATSFIPPHKVVWSKKLARTLRTHNKYHCKINEKDILMKEYDARIQNEKAYMNGGGEQPITRRQIIKIEKLANQFGKTANYVAQYKFGKTISELKGEEANEIIRLLIDKLGLCK